MLHGQRGCVARATLGRRGTWPPSNPQEPGHRRAETIKYGKRSFNLRDSFKWRKTGTDGKLSSTTAEKRRWAVCRHDSSAVCFCRSFPVSPDWQLLLHLLRRVLICICILSYNWPRITLGLMCGSKVNKSLGMFCPRLPSHHLQRNWIMPHHLSRKGRSKSSNPCSDLHSACTSSTWLLEQCECFVDEYALFITNSLRLCEQRRRAQGRYCQSATKTRKKSTVQRKGSDVLYISNSPDPLRPKMSLFCSASTSPSPWLSKETLKTRLKGNRHQK